MRTDRLKLAREQAGHTQESLAQLMNKQIKQIWRWESGTVTPSADALAELCKALNVSADYLLGISDEPSISVSLDGREKFYRDISNIYDSLHPAERATLVDLMESLAVISKRVHRHNSINDYQ